jgi:hypothetical protein
MCVVQHLPNGMIVCLLSPREATMIMDELLHPDLFPWQLTESQMVSLDLREQIRQAIQKQSASELAFATEQLVQQVHMHQIHPQEEQQDEEEE